MLRLSVVVVVEGRLGVMTVNEGQIWGDETMDLDIGISPRIEIGMMMDGEDDITLVGGTK
jgi:hypothetical protein